MVDRILYLINEKGIKPNEIIVLAFTSKAEGEIKDRLRENSTGETIKEVHLSAFHSICRYYLRQFAHLVDIQTDFIAAKYKER